ncbi:MAG: hypothetical protein AAF609_24165 [Cyanobacteria bacterium P01_C01_bin.120]
MESLAALPQIQEQRISGTLGAYEEYADDVGAADCCFSDGDDGR